MAKTEIDDNVKAFWVDVVNTIMDKKLDKTNKLENVIVAAHDKYDVSSEELYKAVEVIIQGERSKEARETITEKVDKNTVKDTLDFVKSTLMFVGAGALVISAYRAGKKAQTVTLKHIPVKK